MDTYQEDLRLLLGQELPWDKLAGKTVMISGATGMIGKCMIDLLMLKNMELRDGAAKAPGADRGQKQPVSVIALSRNKERAMERFGEYWESDTFRYIACDVNQGIPECGRADYIIHAASNTHPLQYSQDSIGTVISNVIGTKNLLDYAVSHHTERFCFVSSVEIYGENRGDTDKFDESYLGYLDCNTLRAGYPESKRAGEALCNAYCQTYQLGFVIPRLSRVYGPTMLGADSKAIAQFIKKAAAGEDIVLKSAGTQLYSYTYALDAAMGIFTVLLKGKQGEAYNISDAGSEVTLKQIAEWLAEDNGMRVVFEIPDETEQKGYSTATRALLSAEKIKTLGWNPQTPMREGLRKTVNAIRTRKPEA